jgi:hypothetical protein
LTDTEQKAHERNPFVWFYGQIAERMGFGKELVKAQKSAATVGSQHWNPGVNSQIHRHRGFR